MENIKKELAKFSQAFEPFTRGEDPEQHWRLKADAKKTYHDLVRKIHGTEMLPDDFRYSIISKISDELIHNIDWYVVNSYEDFEEECAELKEGIVEGFVDIYDDRLLKWFGSHSLRKGYVDEVKIFGDERTIMELIQAGQRKEIEDIYSLFVEEFTQFCKE